MNPLSEKTVEILQKVGEALESPPGTPDAYKRKFSEILQSSATFDEINDDLNKLKISMFDNVTYLIMARNFINDQGQKNFLGWRTIDYIRCRLEFAKNKDRFMYIAALYECLSMFLVVPLLGLNKIWAAVILVPLYFYLLPKIAASTFTKFFSMNNQILRPMMFVRMGLKPLNEEKLFALESTAKQEAQNVLTANVPEKKFYLSKDGKSILTKEEYMLEIANQYLENENPTIKEDSKKEDSKKSE